MPDGSEVVLDGDLTLSTMRDVLADVVTGAHCHVAIMKISDGVEAFKNVMRPLLALIAIIIIAAVYAGADAAARTGMVNELTFGCFTAVFWYFGARYSRASK